MNRYQVPREEPVTGRTCHNTVSNDTIVGLNLATRIEVMFAADPPAPDCNLLSYAQGFLENCCPRGEGGGGEMTMLPCKVKALTYGST